MNRFNILIIFAILLNSFSCKNETAIQLEGLTLNNNEKWVANEETHVGMQRIDSILKNNNSLDGKILSKILSKQTSYIIKSCDMRGKAHEQLHVVLVPILEEITEINDIKNTSEVEKRLKFLQSLIATYFKYFQT